MHTHTHAHTHRLTWFFPSLLERPPPWCPTVKYLWMSPAVRTQLVVSSISLAVCSCTTCKYACTTCKYACTTCKYACTVFFAPVHLKQLGLYTWLVLSKIILMWLKSFALKVDHTPILPGLIFVLGENACCVPLHVYHFM